MFSIEHRPIITHAVEEEIAMTMDANPGALSLERSVRVGKKISEARTQRGLTQEQLGAPEFSASYIDALERGKIPLRVKALSILAKRLQVPQTLLLEDHPHEEGTGDEGVVC
jgi:ribosome-binding protein aMBF1 (putative translation factor)